MAAACRNVQSVSMCAPHNLLTGFISISNKPSFVLQGGLSATATPKFSLLCVKLTELYPLLSWLMSVSCGNHLDSNRLQKLINCKSTTFGFQLLSNSRRILSGNKTIFFLCFTLLGKNWLVPRRSFKASNKPSLQPNHVFFLQTSGSHVPPRNPKSVSRSSACWIRQREEPRRRFRIVIRLLMHRVKQN